MPRFVVGMFVYLRLVWVLTWETFRYPHKTSVIDLETGRVIKRY